MRNTQRKLKLIDEKRAALTRLTDTCGNPSESYNWRHMAEVRRACQQEFWLSAVNATDLSVAEIVNIETRVRKELYP
jgi:hypothetical protein